MVIQSLLMKFQLEIENHMNHLYILLGMEKKKILVMMELSFFFMLIIGIIIGLVFGRLSLILVEYISKKSPSIMDMTLSMSYGSMVFFSLFLVVVTSLSIYFENKKRNKRPLWEVIHVK